MGTGGCRPACQGPFDASIARLNKLLDSVPIYIDNHVLVVEKPAGLLSQADNTGDEDVLTRWKAYLKREFKKPGNVYLGLVHRLDRPVSGVMVLARTSKAASRLSHQFRERLVKKEYLALTESLPDVRGAEPGRMLDYLVKDKGRVNTVASSHPGAKQAELSWRSLGAVGKYQLVLIEPQTGRPHQIRIQFSSRKAPLIGDFRYGSRIELDGRNLALHAWRISFEHPTLKTRLTFAADVPASWPDSVRTEVDYMGDGV